MKKKHMNQKNRRVLALILTATTTMACCTSCSQSVEDKVDMLLSYATKEYSKVFADEVSSQETTSTTTTFVTTINLTTTTTTILTTIASTNTTTTESTILETTTIPEVTTTTLENECNNEISVDAETDAKSECDVEEQEETVEEEENVEEDGTERIIYEVSDGDYIRLCNAVAHEAGADFIATEEKAKVVEVILNRVTSPSYPDTILEVLTQQNQFTGAESYAYMSEFTYKVSSDVECAVTAYLNGEYINHGYFSFWGDGIQNHFY